MTYQQLEARKHLVNSWMALYLLPFKDKTPAIRERMAVIRRKISALKR